MQSTLEKQAPVRALQAVRPTPEIKSHHEPIRPILTISGKRAQAASAKLRGALGDPLQATIEKAAAKAGVSVEEFAKLSVRDQNAYLIETKADKEHPENVEQSNRVAPAALDRSPFNREEFDPEELAKLIESVRERGVIQPLLVRPIRYRLGPLEMELQVGPTGEWKRLWSRFDERDLTAKVKESLGKDRSHLLTVTEFRKFLPEFEIIAGERRWLGATAAKLASVPIIVRDVDDEEAIELQGIENLQRENLNPIHEAQKYQQLLELYQKKRNLDPAAAMDRLAEKVGKAKSTIYEALRLLKLPEETRKATLTRALPPSRGPDYEAGETAGPDERGDGENPASRGLTTTKMARCSRSVRRRI